MENSDWRFRPPGPCAAAFAKMYWAFLFFFDVRIGINNMHVDVLPDFIGWCMMSAALGTIIDLLSVVQTLRTLANWLIFLSLFDLVGIKHPIGRYGAATISVETCFPVTMIAFRAVDGICLEALWAHHGVGD